MTEFHIQPKEFVEKTIVTKFDITDIDVKLFEGASITIMLYADSNKHYKCVSVELTHDEYTNWGTDDNYIRDIVCQKLGFVISN
jgi:hypothetical protein